MQRQLDSPGTLTASPPSGGWIILDHLSLRIGARVEAVDSMITSKMWAKGILKGDPGRNLAWQAALALDPD
ncbi:MAG: hypothetical protein AAF802_15500 [Planctomycetota bacterium]